MSLPIPTNEIERADNDSKRTVPMDTVPSIAWDDTAETRNPRNWSMFERIFNTMIPCVISFEVTFSTSITVPAAGIIATKFSVSRTESLLPLTLYTLGLAFGPLFIAPFSEVYGRRSIYRFSLFFLLLFTGAGTAAPNFPALLVFRFLAGFLGSSAMAIGAGTVADIWTLQKAGGTVGLFFILGPFLGPVVGPVAGTRILKTYDNDWRWTQWLILVIGAPVLLATLFMKETSKTHILRHEDPLRQDPNPSKAAMLALTTIRITLFRAVKMLSTDIVVFSPTLYTAYAYALMFSYFASIPYVFSRYYDFDAQECSLMFLSIMIRYMLAIVLFAIFDRTLYARARRVAEGGLPPPEHRLYSALVGSVFLVFHYGPPA